MMNLNSEMESRLSTKHRGKICGIGVNDAPFTTSMRKDGKMYHHTAYKDWHNMINRCYSGKYPSYQGVVVSEEWHHFMDFYLWWQIHYHGGFQLDKDLFGDKLKYSPATCRYIPLWMNCSLQGGGKPGVHYHKASGLYRSGKDGIFGTFDDEESAWKAWRNNFVNTTDYDIWNSLDISTRERFCKLKDICMIF